MDDHALVVDQYGEAELVARVEDALRRAGSGDGPVSREAIARLDQFHVGGGAATAALAKQLEITFGACL